jgi:putative ABC transport system permease protein
MITLLQFIHLAIQNLRRGGQRVLVAFLCITFGIMALVAMTMLANSIASAVEMMPAQLLGGDISMGRKSEDFIQPENIDQLKLLEQNGEISRYTLIAFHSSVMFHTAGSGEMHFIGNGLGIEPGKYPLAGSLTIGEPGSTGLPTLLQKVGDVVVTRDIAEGYNLKVGDLIVLSDPRVGVPLAGTLREIAYDTPNHNGDKIYYSIETAQHLADGQPVVNTVIVNTSQAQTLTAKLESSGWSVDWAAGRRDTQSANVWVLGLRAAGILGLLVGGIGIANTMQVLLRRRQHEIAILKTLGYGEGHLRLIFALEAGLLGLAGSLLGAGLGVLVSTGLLEFFRSTSTLLYAWTFSSTPPLLGILVGTLTTVIFAYWAIVISSQVRPMALLRNERVDLQGKAGRQSIALGLILAVLFTALTSLVMESVLAGIVVLGCIGIGIAILGGIFSGLLWICTRILPLGKFPLARMAFNSLGRGGPALIFAMIALFIGVLSMSLGMVVAQKSGPQISGNAAEFQSYNLNILAAASQEDAVRRVIQVQNPQKIGLGYRTALASMSAAGGEPINDMDAVLLGRSDPADYILSGAEWGSMPNGVYSYKWSNLTTGSQAVVSFRDGTTRTLTIVGTYDFNPRSINLFPPIGLLMTTQDFTQTAKPDSLIFFVQVGSDQLNRAAAELVNQLPQATVLNLVTYAARFMQSYQKVYLLPMAMAGMALLAGLLLVANSVSLAMLDRRYEIGILKAAGYLRRQILAVFAVEYGMIGLLATGAGVLLIQGMLAVMAIGNHLALSVLLLSIPSLALIVFCGVGLTLLTVIAVTWEPTRVSPLVVLNDLN